MSWESVGRFGNRILPNLLSAIVGAGIGIGGMWLFAEDVELRHIVH